MHQIIFITLKLKFYAKNVAKKKRSTNHVFATILEFYTWACLDLSEHGVILGNYTYIYIYIFGLEGIKFPLKKLES